MNKRDLVYIKHIRDAIELIFEYTKDLDKESFNVKKMTQDATIREIEIIGEATKNVSKDFRDKYPDVHWKKITGMRDKLIHGYFNVDVEKVWNVIAKDIPILKKQIEDIITKEN
ncbi:hypothetical protein LCGC14_1016510 [marine sediment metagenome]|uniref:DUF86 domain-containing protein n=1 Tax=marine sediment metagenome TaxID=412755 RepID=A0A0F9NKB7_9ZZZZ